MSKPPALATNVPTSTLCLAASIAHSERNFIVEAWDSRLVEKDRPEGGPILRRKYHERTTFVVAASHLSIHFLHTTIRIRPMNRPRSASRTRISDVKEGFSPSTLARACFHCSHSFQPSGSTSGSTSATNPVRSQCRRSNRLYARSSTPVRRTAEGVQEAGLPARARKSLLAQSTIFRFMPGRCFHRLPFLPHVSRNVLQGSQPFFQGVKRRLGAAGQVQLAQDVAHVSPHR